MKEDEIRKLYALAISYDNRRLSEANITAWWEQAERNRWTLDEAREAVHQHHAQSAEFLMPAHITAIIKARRQQPARYEPLAIEAAPPAPDDRVRRIVDELARRLGWTRQQQSHTDPALTVECPYCHAQPQRPCTRLVTRGPHRGEHRPIRTPHPSRVDLADECIRASREDQR